MPLETLANVKAALLITTSSDDTLIERLMASAEDLITTLTQRQFAGGTVIEHHAGGSRILFLRNFPIETVVALQADAARQFGSETTLPPERYFVHADRGLIESLDGPFRPFASGTIRVTYTTPASQVPEAVKEAFTQLVGFWYRVVKTQAAMGFRSLLEETDGTTGRSQVYPWNLATGPSLPPGVLQLLKPHRIPVV